MNLSPKEVEAHLEADDYPDNLINLFAKQHPDKLLAVVDITIGTGRVQRYYEQVFLGKSLEDIIDQATLWEEFIREKKDNQYFAHMIGKTLKEHQRKYGRKNQ